MNETMFLSEFNDFAISNSLNIPFSNGTMPMWVHLLQLDVWLYLRGESLEVVVIPVCLVLEMPLFDIHILKWYNKTSLKWNTDRYSRSSSWLSQEWSSTNLIMSRIFKMLKIFHPQTKKKNSDNNGNNSFFGHFLRITSTWATEFIIVARTLHDRMHE